MMDFAASLSFTHIDRKPDAFGFHDSASLDDTILDTPTLMSPSASSTGVFSPNPAMAWDDFSSTLGDRAPPPVHASASNPFYHQPPQVQNNNPFTRLPANQAATYGQEPAAWPEHTGASTPTGPKPLHPFAAAAEYDTAPTGFVPAAHGSSSSSSFGLPAHVRPGSGFHPMPERPLSPHTHSDWMALNQREIESRAGAKRMRAPSPPSAYASRRDGGIRKKNARFEIPSDRNLYNIDKLISEADNDEDLRELKQQKRLLRNRQAALDSRQRKKKHTEDLEEEKKLWTERMTALEDELAHVRLQHDGLAQDKQAWQRERAALHEYVGQLQWDKEEMVRHNTIETGELRKKVSVLAERLEAATSVPLPPSAAAAEFTSNLARPVDWDAYDFDSDLCVDDAPAAGAGAHAVHGAPDRPLVVAAKGRATVPAGGDQPPAASGLLLMLLLCGAFVASKSSGSAAPPIPRMPDDVRAASATVLDSIFKDAGVSPAAPPPLAVAHGLQALEPAPSAVAWPAAHGALASPLAVARPSLGQMHAQLSLPTKEQERDQAFSMTPSQYNRFTTVDLSRPRYSVSTDGGSDASPHRRNLAETLAAMREASKGDTAADVYTRSLLWDKIPSEVVHQFKRMVEESDRVHVSRPPTAGAGSKADVNG